MSYGVGSVMLPFIRRIIVGSIVFQAGFIVYDAALKPGYKTARRILFPSRPKKPVQS